MDRRSPLGFLLGAGLCLAACGNPRMPAAIAETMAPPSTAPISSTPADTVPGVHSPTDSEGWLPLDTTPDPVKTSEPIPGPNAPAPPIPPPPIPPPFEPLLHLDTVERSQLAGDLEISSSLWVEGYGEVWSHDPERLLFPASTQKLLTAAGALNELGGDYVFRTEVRRSGSTLYLVAGGDPTLSTASLHHLARATVAALGSGAAAIEQLVVDVSRYEDAVMAPGWQDWQMPTYTGPLSALMVDDNRWSKTDAFVTAPAEGNGERFRDSLRTAGLGISHPVVVGEAPQASVPVTEADSPPVSELVRMMLLSSDNQTAESLVREVDVVAGGSVRASTAGGLRAIRLGLGQAGVPVNAELGDGSGLSRSNRWSAAQWREFLVAVRSAPWFEDFFTSLPIAGQSGTLAGRFRGTVAAGNLRAKTGTIIGGRALSGYFTTPAGQDAVFSITLNGENSHAALGLLDALAIEMVQRSSALPPLPPPGPTGQ